jgi:hypothetical protein
LQAIWRAWDSGRSLLVSEPDRRFCGIAGLLATVLRRGRLVQIEGKLAVLQAPGIKSSGISPVKNHYL